MNTTAIPRTVTLQVKEVVTKEVETELKLITTHYNAKLVPTVGCTGFLAYQPSTEGTSRYFAHVEVIGVNEGVVTVRSAPLPAAQDELPWIYRDAMRDGRMLYLSDSPEVPQGALTDVTPPDASDEAAFKAFVHANCPIPAERLEEISLLVGRLIESARLGEDEELDPAADVEALQARGLTELISAQSGKGKDYIEIEVGGACRSFDDDKMHQLMDAAGASLIVSDSVYALTDSGGGEAFYLYDLGGFAVRLSMYLGERSDDDNDATLSINIDVGENAVETRRDAFIHCAAHRVMDVYNNFSGENLTKLAAYVEEMRVERTARFAAAA